jgi:hypothetical protein
MIAELLRRRAAGESWQSLSERFNMPITTLRNRARGGAKQSRRKTAPLTLRRVLSGRDGAPRYVKTASLLDFFSASEIKQSGLAHFARDYGTPLDLLAQALESEGHIRVPGDCNADEYLLQLLLTNAVSMHDQGDYLEIEYRDYCRRSAKRSTKGA